MRRAQPLAADRLEAQLELQRRQDRHEVGVPAALPVAVHRALDEARAASTATSELATPQPASSWVWMPTWTAAELDHHRGGGLGHLARQRGAVRVAERHVLGTGLRGGPEAAQRVGGVVAPGVEEVLRVVDHALALAHEERHRVGDHPQVLLGVDLRDLLEVERPRLADQRADRREGVGQQPAAPGRRRQLTSRRRVIPNAATSAFSKRSRREQLEELLLLGVRRREAGLDQVHAERRRARAPRAASRRPRATCPRPACRRAGWCRRPGPSVSLRNAFRFTRTSGRRRPA